MEHMRLGNEFGATSHHHKLNQQNKQNKAKQNKAKQNKTKPNTTTATKQKETKRNAD